MEGVFGSLVCFFGIAVIFVFGFLVTAVRVVQEYERGVVFRLGRLVGAKGPGLFLLYPFIDRMIKVDLRVITLDFPAQEGITRDNVTLKINAVVYFMVTDPAASIVKVEDYRRATWQIAQTTLRNVIGQSELDELLAERDKINDTLQQIIDEAPEPWGVKVTLVEIKDVELPPTMQRAMARQAESEREKRAKIIHASGEYEASKQLAEAAAIIGSESATLQLRFLQTLTEISAEKNSTIIFPLPIELFKGMMDGYYNGNKEKASE
jgi:regulator of protease activity HflC (stomatin/prohibitin superfamily)